MHNCAVINLYLYDTTLKVCAELAIKYKDSAPASSLSDKADAIFLCAIIVLRTSKKRPA